MSLEGEIIFLDLHEVTLLGVQPTISSFGVEKKLKEIEENREIMPVDIVEIKPNAYRLVDEGHHTSRAHYESCKPLKCRVVSGDKLYMRFRKQIQDIVVL